LLIKGVPCADRGLRISPDTYHRVSSELQINGVSVPSQTLPETLKKNLRLRCKQAREKLKPRVKKQFDHQICTHLYGNLPLDPPDIIAGFSPLMGEPDILLLLDTWLDEKRKVCLPVVTEKAEPLQFRFVQKAMKLFPNQLFPNLQEPPKTAQLCHPHVILIPLLAYDSEGFRLGYGGGFYDRTIERIKQNPRQSARLLTIGVAYSMQRVKKLPRDIHDQPLDCVVTEKGVEIFS
jgi:5-formyltetrahydrofolate cyclo-ligase